uniref:hypothetical protein n=1 Tax=Flavobacterium sp. TaxID=239 RepID=UPI00404B7394
MVLLDLFYKLRFDICVVHCNFQLRGKESDGDELFVKVKSEKLKVKSYFIRFDTEEYTKENKLSIQLAARKSVIFKPLVQIRFIILEFKQ